jgi:hypothetical protein
VVDEVRMPLLRLLPAAVHISDRGDLPVQTANLLDLLAVLVSGINKRRKYSSSRQRAFTPASAMA